MASPCDLDLFDGDAPCPDCGVLVDAVYEDPDDPDGGWLCCMCDAMWEADGTGGWYCGYRLEDL